MQSTDGASAAEATGQAAVKAKGKPSFLASCFSAATPPKASSRDGDDSPAFTDPCKALDPFARGNQAGASTSGGSTGVWQILWGRDGAPQRMAFEAITAV